MIVLSDDLIKGSIPYVCIEWNNFPRAAAEWFAFFNKEVCFPSELVFEVWKAKIRTTSLTNYDDDG